MIPQLSLDGGAWLSMTNLLSGLTAVVCMFALIMGAVYVYHWHAYGVRTRRALVADVVYFVGLLILIGLAATLRLTI